MGIPASAEVHPLEIGREGAHVVEMQRRRLLLAMEELAGEDGGLADATVGAVCKRSRVSRRTFYDLFDDRDGCFLAAFEHAVEQVAQTVLPAYKRKQRWRECIRAGLEALLVALDEQPQFARVCVIEAAKGGPAVLARRRELLDTLANAVDEGRAEARGTGPPALTAESVVGGVLAVIHARLLQPDSEPLVGLVPALTAMIVLPYLGQAASQREAERPVSTRHGATCATNGKAGPMRVPADPFRDMPIRITYRTARVLAVIAADPGASNRKVGDEAGASDQGQVSKLLKRLEQAGMIENHGPGGETGEPNAWRLTPRGEAIRAALGAETG